MVRFKENMHVSFLLTTWCRTFRILGAAFLGINLLASFLVKPKPQKSLPSTTTLASVPSIKSFSSMIRFKLLKANVNLSLWCIAAFLQVVYMNIPLYFLPCKIWKKGGWRIHANVNNRFFSLRHATRIVNYTRIIPGFYYSGCNLHRPPCRGVRFAMEIGYMYILTILGFF